MGPLTALAPLTNLEKCFQSPINFGFEKGLCKENPVAKIRPPRPDKAYLGTPERYLSDQQAKMFLEWAKENEEDYYPVFLVLIRTGLRLGEMLALRIEDFRCTGTFRIW